MCADEAKMLHDNCCALRGGIVTALMTVDIVMLVPAPTFYHIMSCGRRRAGVIVINLPGEHMRTLICVVVLGRFGLETTRVVFVLIALCWTFVQRFQPPRTP